MRIEKVIKLLKNRIPKVLLLFTSNLFSQVIVVNIMSLPGGTSIGFKKKRVCNESEDFAMINPFLSFKLSIIKKFLGEGLNNSILMNGWK